MSKTAAPAEAKRKLTRAEKKQIAAVIRKYKGDGKPHIGGYKWSIAVGDKAMRIELRPEDWAEGAYEIYATPEAE